MRKFARVQAIVPVDEVLVNENDSKKALAAAVEVLRVELTADVGVLASGRILRDPTIGKASLV